MDSKIEMNDSHSREIKQKNRRNLTQNLRHQMVQCTNKIHSTATTYG